jgi:hypothetical protein
MSLSPIYDPHPPAHTVIAVKWRTISSFSKKLSTQTFSLPFGLQTTYRIFKNRFRKFISRWFWTYLQFLSSTILSQENPSRNWWHWSERICRARNRLLPQQNLSDLYRRFLDGFSRLRRVLDRN